MRTITFHEIRIGQRVGLAFHDGPVALEGVVEGKDALGFVWAGGDKRTRIRWDDPVRLVLLGEEEAPTAHEGPAE